MRDINLPVFWVDEDIHLPVVSTFFNEWLTLRLLPFSG